MRTLTLVMGLVMALTLLPKVHAQETQRQVVEASSARSKGEQKVVIRGLLDLAPQANGNVLMVFPGWPGIPRIELRNGQPAFFYLQQHVERMRPVLHAAGISLLTVDCPTDQWGQRGPNPSACDDDFRSSEAYADDVRRLIEQVRSQQTLTRFFAMGTATAPSAAIGCLCVCQISWLARSIQPPSRLREEAPSPATPKASTCSPTNKCVCPLSTCTIAMTCAASRPTDLHSATAARTG